MLTLSPGTVVADKYRLVRPLGQGGMGSVWLAEHLSLDSEVAVKFIRPERAASDPSVIRRFEREAKAAAKISSPHVVQIKDYGLVDTTPYIVMERLRGASLNEVLARDGRFSLTRTQALVADVAEALEQAHALGIVHRDIKPQNIFLVDTHDEPFVKVLDFGVAKVVSDAAVPGGTAITETGVIVGSPPYMSPEQLEGLKEVDHRADTWSLAIVAYQALTGTLPFEGGSFVAVGAAVLRGRYAPVTERRPGLPAALDDWFAKALCLDVEGRFASARGMAQALQAIDAAHDEPATSSRRAVIAHATTQAQRAPLDATVTSATPATAPSETASSIAYDMRPPADRWRMAKITSAGVLGLAAVATLAVTLWPSESPPADPPPVVLAPGSCPAGMRYIERGSFLMGSNAGDDVRKDETPLHRVELDAFCLDTHEVTVRAYNECERCGPPPQSVEGKEITSKAQTFWSQFCNAGRFDRLDHPINCVSWDQAKAYCDNLGKRLPTEEEWELAARGSEGREYPWGNAGPSPVLVNACGGECNTMLSEMLQAIGSGSWSALYDDDDGAPSTAPVGSFREGATPEGVMDLAGNVWEWTESAYCYYDEGSCVESRRVLRGGGWDTPDAAAVRATRRHPGAPNGRGHNIGFRCAWSAR